MADKCTRWFAMCAFCKQKVIVDGIYHEIAIIHARDCDRMAAVIHMRWSNLRDRQGYPVQPEQYLKNIRPIKWTYRPDPTECDGRCMGAKGPNCDCKCKGANHGAGQIAQVPARIGG